VGIAGRLLGLLVCFGRICFESNFKFGCNVKVKTIKANICSGWLYYIGKYTPWVVLPRPKTIQNEVTAVQ
jgi:hypothetical protein